MSSPRSEWMSWMLAGVIAPAMPMAYASDYLSITQAQQLMFPRATQFISMPILLNQADKTKIQEQTGLKQRWNQQQAFKVMKNQEHLGWLMIDDVIGKHEFITYALAISPQGSILGIEILTYRETHGGQIRHEKWRKHFIGKTNKDPFQLDQDVPNITGATLSCRNVLSGTKRLLVIYEIFLRGRA